jgi:hypothetical protein
MNKETGTEAAQFLEKEYIMEFSLQCLVGSVNQTTEQIAEKCDF